MSSALSHEVVSLQKELREIDRDKASGVTVEVLGNSLQQLRGYVKGASTVHVSQVMADILRYAESHHLPIRSGRPHCCRSSRHTLQRWSLCRGYHSRYSVPFCHSWLHAHMLSWKPKRCVCLQRTSIPLFPQRCASSLKFGANRTVHLLCCMRSLAGCVHLPYSSSNSVLQASKYLQCQRCNMP